MVKKNGLNFECKTEVKKRKPYKKREIKHENDLKGINEISNYYYGLSHVTIVSLINNEGFPATKIKGIYVSDKKLVDEYKIKKINENVGKRRR
jgi:hypothetical protein